MKRAAIFQLDSDGRLGLIAGDSRDMLRRIEGVERDEVPTGMRFEDEAGGLSLCIAPFHPNMADAAEADQDLFEAQRLFFDFRRHSG